MTTLLSTYDAARVLEVTPETIRKMLNRGTLRAANARPAGRGNMRLFALDELERVKALPRGGRTLGVHLQELREDLAAATEPEPEPEPVPADQPEAMARYVAGPLRQARELAERSTRCLSRVLLESDALRDRQQRDQIEALILVGGEYVAQLNVLLQQIAGAPARPVGPS